MLTFLKIHRVQIIWLTTILVVIACVSIAVWKHGWEWTGFATYETTTQTGTDIVTETHPAKTLWDILDLAIIPVVLAIGAFLLNRSQSKNDQAIALNQQQEVLVQGYIDAMTALVLEKHLRSTKDDNEQDIDLRNIARSRTLTVLRALNTPYGSHSNRRKGSLVRFLYETQLISGEKPVISLRKANLNEAYMHSFDLRKVNLWEAYLYKADLREAILEESILDGAYLVKANLWKAKLPRVKLAGANLEGANLTEADLEGANLAGANLQGANLTGVTLTDANMEKVDLRGANLLEAKLTNSNLKGSIYGKYLNKHTRWPENFDYQKAGAILHKSD